MNLIRGMQVPHTEYKNPVVFGGGQRSFGVTRGQTLKTLCTQYLKKGNYDGHQTWHSGTPYQVQEPYRFGRGQRSFVVTRVQTVKTLFM